MSNFPITVEDGVPREAVGFAYLLAEIWQSPVEIKIKEESDA